MNYEQLLIELISNDNRYFVMTAENRAAMRGITNQIKNNFIDTGITEQTMIGMAAGLALRGRIPIVHALATFLTMRAFEFIRTDVGIANLPVKIMGSVAGFLSEANGPTHQAIEDVSIMRGIPNVNVFCPADIQDFNLGIRKVLEHPNPFYIRYLNLPNVIEHQNFEIGKAEIFDNGNDVAILVYGMLFTQAFNAKKILEEKGYSVRLLNLRTLKPVDEQAILKAVDECKLIVTLEDHFITGGLFTILAEILLKNKKTTNVLPLALMDKWFKPALLNDVLEYEGFTSEKISQTILSKFEEMI